MSTLCESLLFDRFRDLGPLVEEKLVLRGTSHAGREDQEDRSSEPLRSEELLVF